MKYIIRALKYLLLFSFLSTICYCLFYTFVLFLEKKERESISIDVSYDPVCNSIFKVEAPLLKVTVTNNNSKTLKEVKFNIAAYFEGMSDNLIQEKDRTWSVIVDPLRTETYFYWIQEVKKTGYKPNQLVYNIDSYHPVFYDKNEFIPKNKAGKNKSNITSLPKHKTEGFPEACFPEYLEPEYLEDF